MSSTVEGGRQREDFEFPNGGRRQSAQTETDQAVSDDAVFEVLSNRRRRRVIEYLYDHDGAATVGELAEHIATAENGTTIQELSSDDRKCVYVSLYQNHLPVMDDANVVDYDENRKRVQLLDGASKVKPYLGGVDEPASDRVSVAAVLTIAGCVLLGGFQVGPFAAVSPSAWALLGVVGLIGATGFEAWRSSGAELPRLLATVAT